MELANCVVSNVNIMNPNSPEALFRSKVIETSDTILVASHLAPDLDAFCSALLMSRTIQQNYTGKKIVTLFEDEPYGVSELQGHDNIVNMPLENALDKYEPDGIIVVDTNRYKRITRLGEAALWAHLQDHDVKTAVVDHHELSGGDKFDVAIQDPTAPAAVQLVYDLLFNYYNMDRPKGYELITLVGLIADSGTFKYPYDYSQTKLILRDLEEHNVDSEKAMSIVYDLDEDQQKIVNAFKRNLTRKDGFAYSYIGDLVASGWRKNNENPAKIKAACVSFGNKLTSKPIDANWGFIVHPNPSKIKGQYYASFRSKDGAKNVTEISRRLGAGGGHKTAAGVAFEADNIKGAIQLVLDTIADIG